MMLIWSFSIKKGYFNKSKMFLTRCIYFELLTTKKKRFIFMLDFVYTKNRIQKT